MTVLGESCNQSPSCTSHARPAASPTSGQPIYNALDTIGYQFMRYPAGWLTNEMHREPDTMLMGAACDGHVQEPKITGPVINWRFDDGDTLFEEGPLLKATLIGSVLGPSGVILADINKDGHDDLLVQFAEELAVLHGPLGPHSVYELP